MEVENVSPKQLKLAHFNPSERAENIKRLKKSILKYGIMQPILATQNFKVVDGHRRIAVAKELNLETIPVIRYNGKTEELHSELFETINTTSMKLNSAQQLKVWLKGGAIDKSTEKSITDLLGFADMDFLERMAKENQNPVTYRIGLRTIQKYLQTPESFNKKICEYMLQHGVWNVRRATNYNAIKPSKLLMAIKKNLPLRKEFTI